LRQLEGRRGVASRQRCGERWLVKYVARRGNDHPTAAAVCGAPGGMTPEPRQRQRHTGCCLAGVGAWPRHRRPERKRRRDGGRPRPLLKRSRQRGAVVGGPILGSRHETEGMGRGLGPTGGRRWPVATHCQRAGSGREKTGEEEEKPLTFGPSYCTGSLNQIKPIQNNSNKFEFKSNPFKLHFIQT
jgi:hypothetical protein